MKKRTRNIAAAKIVEEHRALLDGLSVPQLAALQSTFLSFSTDAPGFIHSKQLGPLLRELGDDPSPSELASLIHMVEASGNGLLDLEEFAALLAIRTQHKHSKREVREAIKVSARQSQAPAGARSRRLPGPRWTWRRLLRGTRPGLPAPASPGPARCLCDHE